MKNCNIEDIRMSPSSIGIITTYKCTANCEDCCFVCSPKCKSRLKLEDIYSIIDNAFKIKSIKVVVFTGGEATLLNSDLIKAIEYSKNNGFITRLVTNGHWGISDKKANEWVKKLKYAGLDEINFSTGDNHQRFIPLDSVLRASKHTVEHGILTLISVETAKNLKFKESDLLNNQIYKNIKSSTNGNLLCVEPTTWVSMTEPAKYDYEFNNNYGDYRCDSLFNDITVDALGNVYSCCGLNVRTIEEMNLGNIRDGNELKFYYEKQYENLLKRWLFVEGPYNVLRQVLQWNGTVKIPQYAHKCLYCNMVFNNQTVKETLKKI